ncbi:MAG: D-tyrosyl-tRNA(Tyr) deacylase [Actinobacteria bacterium]|nr:D-tyrosyl-tRNA(Tyr) deacylase [Actinomycetota bacterium]|tara:strand:+ start:4482 stop:4937 length:456 start_codon:yes stop_codon:yes gene_type:complete
MKVVLQRVTDASVNIDSKQISKIGYGLLLLWGVEKGDTEEDAEALSDKISNLRIFSDENNKMNRSIVDIDGEILIVSQFTLNANIKKGNRPSFIDSEDPKRANDLIQVAVERFISKEIKVQTGKFGALMDIQLNNNGPVTIILNSQDSTVS